MSLEKITHGIGNFTRTVAATGLLGLSVLMGSYTAYAQQQAKIPTNNIAYVQCRSGRSSDESMTQSLSLIGVLLGSSKNPDKQTLGAAASVLGQMEHEKDVAREGRSQVNVNVNQSGGRQEQAAMYVPAPGCVWANPENPNDLSVRKSMGIAFVANYWKDLNYDGRADLNEYVGVKDRFYDDETMILVFYDAGGQGIDKSLEVKVYDPHGKRVFKKKVVGGWTGVRPNLRPGTSKHYKLDWDKKKSGDGNYTIVWRTQGVTETAEFKIIPSSERPKKQ